MKIGSSNTINGDAMITEDEVVWSDGPAESKLSNQNSSVMHSAASLAIALESGDLGIWELDVRTSHIDYSDGWCAMLGFEKGELSADFPTWQKLVHPEDKIKAKSAIELYLSGNTPAYSLEFRMQHKNGEWRWISSKGKISSTDEQGKPARIVGTHQDITARKNAEIALAEEIDQFKSAMEFSSIGIALVSLQGDWLKVNPAICRIVGYSEEELLATDFQSITHPDDLEADLEFVTQVASGERASYEMEKRYFHKQGHTIWVLLSVSLARDNSGNPRHFISQIQDITERKNAEFQAARYLEELERSNKELDDFAYIASHDLREPLRAINNHSQYLVKQYTGKLDEKASRRLDRLVYLTQRMDNLVNDLLGFSRLGKMEEELFDTDLNQLVAEEIALISGKNEDPAICIELIDELPQVAVSRTQIATVFRNLIINGIKYNRSAVKKIEIGIERIYKDAQRELSNVIYVRDNGIGIDPQFHDTVFGMFKRLSNENMEPGTGAGLAYVKRIIDQIGGTIFIDSVPEKGTTVYFTLGET